MGQYGQITKEIRAPSEQFLKAEFVHERRESNHDAHSLARSAIHNSLGRGGSLIRLRAFVISTLLLISVEFPPQKIRSIKYRLIIKLIIRMDGKFPDEPIKSN